MPKFLFVTALSLLFYYCANAQFNDARSKSVTFGINGFSNLSLNPSVEHGSTLLFRYFPKENLAYRFLLDLGINSTGNTTDDGAGTKTSTTINANAYGLGIGFQRSIAKFDKFNAYAGADLIGNYGRNIKTNRTDYSKTTTKADSGDYKETITLAATPFVIGVYPMIGINYFFSKHFSAGLEYSLNVSYSLPAMGETTVNQTYFAKALDQANTHTGSTAALNVSTNNNVLMDISVYF